MQSVVTATDRYEKLADGEGGAGDARQLMSADLALPSGGGGGGCFPKDGQIVEDFTELNWGHSEN